MIDVKLVKELDVRVSEDEINATVSAVLGRGRARRRNFVVAISVAGALVATTAVYAVRTSHVTKEPYLVVLDSTAAGGGPLRLADGVLVSPAASTTRLKLASSDNHDVAVELEQGRARFDIPIRSGPPFTVRARGVLVRVMGTQFEIAIEETDGREEVALVVQSGAAEIHHGDSRIVLQPGGRWRTDSTLAPGDPPHEAIDEPGKKPLSAAPMPRQAKKPTALLAEADGARRDRRYSVAVALLERLIKENPHHDSAPVAAFMAGRILADDLRRPAAAARAFQRARMLLMHGKLRDPHLAEVALAREAEALFRAGDVGRAAELRASYHRLYPGGQYATMLRWQSE